MANNKIWRSSLFITVCTVVTGFACPSVMQGQDGSKGIQSSEVLARPIKPPTATNSKRPAKQPRRNVTYRSSERFTKTPPARRLEFGEVGVTIWRLQGDGTKGFEQVGEEAQTLEQVEASTELAIGSRVRLGIEPLKRGGYLYVIDREQFADGSYGTARLIFPTTRTRKGNNLVRAFERVLIPARPSYFRINPSSSGKTQTAEVLTIIVSPTELQLPDPLSDKPMTISPELFKQWETKWTAPFIELEMEGGVEVTTGTKDLGQIGEESQQLTDDDPYPQTVYRATISRGNAMLVTVPLRFGNADTPQEKKAP